MSTNGKILYVGETSRPAALDLVLEGQGYQILTASDVNAALRMLQVRDFEAMMVEARLLDVDREQWRRVNASYPGMPVLGISEPVQAPLPRFPQPELAHRRPTAVQRFHQDVSILQSGFAQGHFHLGGS